MVEAREDICEAIDRSVLAGLRDLQVKGDPDIIVEVGDLFIKHSPSKISAILQAAESGDAKGLQIAAHSLKSSSAYIGAMRLSALSKELEQMGRSNAMNGVKEKARMLEAEYKRVMTALKTEIELANESANKQ
jgi:HPt (histidine-containing phosphotransfer) domain-containing protein